MASKLRVDAVKPVGARRRLANVYASHRYALLFYTLILTLSAAPLLSALQLSGDLLQIFVAFNLLVAILDVPGQTSRTVLIVLAAVAVGLRIAPASAIGEGLATGALVGAGGLAMVGVASAIRFALRGKVVDAEHVYAALSAYLLAGLFFGVLHWVVAIVWPGSIAEAGRDLAAGLSLPTAIYYSFVTIATLGYGDVVPRTDVARGLAMLEAVAGQLYIAVVIARLVGARLQAPG
jgi:ion channel